MKIHELKELHGLTLKQISEKTGIQYDRVCKLNRQVAKYNMNDYELIKQYVRNLGKNVIHIDFTPNTEKRVPFSWERRGEINLNDYRRKKESMERVRGRDDSKRRYQEMFVRARQGQN